MNDEEHDNECEWASEACGCDSRKTLRAENTKLRDQRDRLATAAKAVTWFDWCDNDEDAVQAIEGLRAILAEIGEGK